MNAGAVLDSILKQMYRKGGCRVEIFFIQSEGTGA